MIALMMEAASTSETSVNFYQTTRGNKAEDSRFHTRRRENLKSHQQCQSSS
jgi:GH25 family lysozyme M1 (1,4-beta-N-acetylmuramidase)